ncbi:DUF6868 family protein [Flocculibacter collagenilyticus]|uniref:DUF6868 family protein n=1 Tax=Flocculibacter collagenilyticus TaxID=2744479 RepID=UPI0018F29778|nr:hypothetical protein [Flocculibacter collagenilyticus]
MTIEQLTAFFGWMAVINIGFLTLAFILLTLFRGAIIGIHSQVYKVSEPDLQKIYLTYLAQYKIFTFIFSVAPFVALKFFL